MGQYACSDCKKPVAKLDQNDRHPIYCFFTPEWSCVCDGYVNFIVKFHRPVILALHIDKKSTEAETVMLEENDY